MGCQAIVMGARGRMGTTIANMVINDPGIELAAVVERPGNESELDHFGVEYGANLDAMLPKPGGTVIINFTFPEPTMDMARIAHKHGTAAVIGTTGLNAEQQAELAEIAKDIPLFWAPNMSVGINVLLEILPLLVQKLGDAYDMEMFEVHHRMKKDAPSGTAIKLAQCLAEAKGWDYDAVKNYCRDGMIGERPDKEIGVQTLRGGDVVGEHSTFFFGPGERIEVVHRAHSRDTFAAGAIRAAKWLATQKPGKLYTMQDIF